MTAAIVGVSNPQQVAGIIGAAEFRPGHNEIDELEDALSQESVLAKSEC